MSSGAASSAGTPPPSSSRGIHKRSRRRESSRAPGCPVGAPSQALPEGVELCTADSAELARALIDEHHRTMLALGEIGAVSAGWEQSQQAVVRNGNATLAVAARVHGAPQAIVAASVCSRSATVLLIHVVPAARGPMRLPERLWRELRGLLHAAIGNRSRRLVYASSTCAEAPQAAHFWLRRCGWTGNELAEAAAERWAHRDSACALDMIVGDYLMWCEV